MSRICQITGKRLMFGNRRSHAMNATRRRFIPNVHVRRFWVEEENRFITLCVSAKGIRTIDKKGIKNFLPIVFRGKYKKRITTRIRSNDY